MSICYASNIVLGALSVIKIHKCNPTSIIIRDNLLCDALSLRVHSHLHLCLTLAHLGLLLLLDCKIEPFFMKLCKCYKEGKTLCSPSETL